MKPRYLKSIATVLLFAVVFMASCAERKEAHYRSVAEVRDDRAIERGWIPSKMPPSSTDIRELHYVDGTVGWGSFVFNVKDTAGVANLKTNCRSVTSPTHISPPPHVRWWPEYLTGEIVPSHLTKEGLEAYECDEPNTKMFIALNVQTGSGYFWHP